MNARPLLIVALLAPSACAPDYIDLGYDHAAIGTGGSGGASLCSSGETRDCYSGPEGTEGVGNCKPGQQTCNADGTAFGACEGERIPEPEDCSTPGDEDCDGYELVCGGDPLWGYRAGGAFVQEAGSVAVDAAGNVLLAGRFTGTMDFGSGLAPLVAAGGPRGFVAGLSKAGTAVWARRLGDPDTNNIEARATFTSGGDIVVGGYFTGSLDLGGATPTLTSAGIRDVFVAKLDASGGPIWARRFGDKESQQLFSISADAGGNVILVGEFQGVLDFGLGAPLSSAGTSDLFVAKLDASGAPVWARSFGDSQVLAARSTIDSAGNVVLAGEFGGIIDAGNGPTLASAGATDAFVLKVDPSGGLLWARKYGDAQGQGCKAVTVDATGNVFLAGDFEGFLEIPGLNQPLKSAGKRDVFVTKLDVSGTPKWAVRFGNEEEQRAGGIAVDVSGNIIVAGDFRGTIEPGNSKPPLTTAGGPDVFVLKLDALGAALWARRYGDGDSQECVGVGTDAAGNIVFAGSFGGTIEPGGGLAPLTSAENLDVFAVMLGP